jgi:hypothetical protein
LIKGSYQISLYIYQKYNIIFYGTMQMQGNVLFTCCSDLSIEHEKNDSSNFRICSLSITKYLLSS